MLEHEGLIAGLVEKVRQKGGDHKTAREMDVAAIIIIAMTPKRPISLPWVDVTY